MDAASYTAASTMPVKLLRQLDICVPDRIVPVHVQFNPTNKCPLNCSYCSCKNRDKQVEMDLECAFSTMYQFIVLGAKAITITGGGDPLAWPHINIFIENIYRKLRVGLVTDAVLVKNFSTLSLLTWCRISMSAEHLPDISNFVCSSADIGISYVITGKQKNTDSDNIKRLQKEYGKYVTHIRVVEDILDSECTPIEEIRKEAGPCDKVIWQGRKRHGTGTKKCLVSLLKPNITPEGLVTPCCGVQYAGDPPDLAYTEKYSMGTIEDIRGIWEGQRFFDGSICKKCYYGDYNTVLNAAYKAGISHKEFI